jgi:hypothetical protein
LRLCLSTTSGTSVRLFTRKRSQTAVHPEILLDRQLNRTWMVEKRVVANGCRRA